MSQNVTERYELIKSYEAGIISLSELQEKISLSRQQVYRIIKNYHNKGIQGLYHGNKNKPSHHSYNPSKKEQIMSLIGDKYYDCGASYARELLEEYEGIKINRETLRLWMKQEQLLIKQRKRKPYRKRRERKTANDWTIKYKAKTYQILRKNYCPAKSTVLVKETFTGKIFLLFKNQVLSYRII